MSLAATLCARAARRLLLLLGVVMAIAAFAAPARAHDFQPGVLAVVERGPNRFDVAWTAPVAAGDPDEVRVVYPQGCAEASGTLTCDGPLRGAIAFEGLSARAKVVVTVRWRDGRTQGGVASSASPRVELGEGAPSSLGGWVALGAEHVFTGLDHEAFVVGLFLVVGPQRRRLLATITSFTVAHSLTLALSTLHVVALPRAPVEATIAASVLLVAKESTSAAPTLARTRPWLVAFLFGLVHGLGFAGALAELPLPAGRFGAALLAFNVGVEIAQLALVSVLLLAVGLAARARVPLARRALAARATSYVIGALGAWWLFDRAYSVLKR